MEYNKTAEGKYELLDQKNVDTGMGVERTVAVLQGKNSVYEIGTFLPIIKKIEELSGKKYGKNVGETKAMRIIADHIKAAVFIINEGILPSNIEQGYVLRRLIRRAIRYGREIGLEDFTYKVATSVFEIYDNYFPKGEKKIRFLKEPVDNRKFILDEIAREEMRFRITLAKGLRKFNEIAKNLKNIDGKNAFLLFQSYGFPIEMTKELAEERGISVNEKGFEEEFKKHQKISRAGAEKKFGSGLADTTEQTVKLHTTTHLLNEALRRILKKRDIIQKGSNITPERLRFDFNFDRKLTDKEIKDVEDLVNEQIKKALPVKRKETTLEEAKKMGAQAVFEQKYGEKIFVYFIGDFSLEICSGPHVKNTKELGKFKIVKEEGISSGIRRIRAILES